MRGKKRLENILFAFTTEQYMKNNIKGVTKLPRLVFFALLIQFFALQNLTEISIIFWGVKF